MVNSRNHKWSEPVRNAPESDLFIINLVVSWPVHLLALFSPVRCQSKFVLTIGLVLLARWLVQCARLDSMNKTKSIGWVPGSAVSFPCPCSCVRSLPHLHTPKVLLLVKEQWTNMRDERKKVKWGKNVGWTFRSPLFPSFHSTHNGSLHFYY